MRTYFDEQLEILNKEIIEMGALCESALKLVGDFFNNEEENRIFENNSNIDDIIDSKELYIEKICLRLLLQHQPVANDLRHILSYLKIITDLERIGDQAEDIIDILFLAKNKEAIRQNYLLRDMARNTIGALNKSINALIKDDIIMAKNVIEDDILINNCFLKIKKDLLESIKENKNGDKEILDILMISKYLERIGDHASNICEWVIFKVTGAHKEEKN